MLGDADADRLLLPQRGHTVRQYQCGYVSCVALHHSLLMFYLWYTEDDLLPLIDSRADVLRICSLFVLVELVNLLSPDSYRPSQETWTATLYPGVDTLCRHNCNAMPTKIRMQCTYSRGLVAQSLQVLSDRVDIGNGSIQSVVYEPMLAWTLLQLRLRMDLLYPTTVRQSPNGDAQQRMHELFCLQAGWILDYTPLVAELYGLYGSMYPTPSAIRWDKWQFDGTPHIVDTTPCSREFDLRYDRLSMY